jgi:hypothetical protein
VVLVEVVVLGVVSSLSSLSALRGGVLNLCILSVLSAWRGFGEYA